MVPYQLDGTAFIEWVDHTIMVSGIGFSSDDDEGLAIEYLYSIGMNHARRGMPKDAIFYFDKVLLIEPSHTRALFNKANALGKLGKYEEAILLYDSILKTTPAHSESLLNKGLAFHYLGRYDEAISCYDAITALEPRNASAFYQTACTKALQKKQSESLKALERAILLDQQFATKAGKDADFSDLHGDPRFQALVS